MTELGWRWAMLEVLIQMERKRAENNVNWMHSLRLNVLYAPKDEVKKLFAGISGCDQGITELWTIAQSKIPD